MEPNVQRDFPYIVRLYKDQDCADLNFVGSGVQIGPRLVLSCAHVAEKRVAWAKFCTGKIVEIERCDFTPERVREPQEDIALIHLKKEVGGDTARFLRDLPNTYWQPSNRREHFALGQKELTPFRLGAFIGSGPIQVHCLVHAQVCGTIHPGYSGGPIVCFQHDRWW